MEQPDLDERVISNPFNATRKKAISLRPQDVDGGLGQYMPCVLAQVHPGF